MSSDRVDPKAPHAFVKRLNMPFAAPRSGGPSMAPEIAFRRENALPGCSICGKDFSDHIHEAATKAADAEKWPV